MKMQLQELKKALVQSRHELQQYHFLLQKREDELEKIQALKRSIEEALFEMHRIEKKNPRQAEKLKEKMVVETEEISARKKTLKAIDAELDHLGEEKDEAVTKIKKELTERIYERHPDQKKVFEEIDSRHRENSQTLNRLQEQFQLLQPLVQTFNASSQVKSKMGFFDFLFGRHPHAHLARLIQQAVQNIESVITRIDEPPLKDYLDKFLKEAQNPENRSLYQGRFHDLVTEFRHLMAMLEQEIDRLKLDLKFQEEKLENWINKYS